MDQSLIQQQPRYHSTYGGPRDKSPYLKANNMHSDDNGEYRRGGEKAVRNFSSAYSSSGQHQVEPDGGEEELYNRRRDEEIRRHTQSRGSSHDISQRQINHKSSDYAKNRLDQSSLSMISPLQHRESGTYIDGHTYETFGSSLPTRDKTPYSQGLNMGSGSSSNMRDSGVPSHVKEHMAIVANDNSSLLRRLNLVNQELERVHREKDELFNRSILVSQDNSEMQRHLSVGDHVDKENRCIHDDINYQKDKNKTIRQKLKDCDIQKAELLRQLRKAEDKQDLCASQSWAQQQDLTNRLNQIVEIEKEHYYTQEKIKQVNAYLEQLRLEIHRESRDKLEIQEMIQALHQERRDLLDKLDHLTSKYDECVAEISHDRHEMEASNQKHEKLVAAKIIFQELEALSKTKIRNGFGDVKSYCEFDKNCHGKLRQLAGILTKIGKYRLKNGITQWYSNALQPIRGKQQSSQLALKSHTDKLKQRMFYQWFKQYQGKISSYDNKTAAVKSIWHICQKDTIIEVKRSFAIWKDSIKRQSLQRHRVQKLLWKLYFAKLSKAISKWVSYSMKVDSQVRLNLLCSKFSQKQYLTLLFNNFKEQSKEQKRKRHNIAIHVLKAWQDYIRHRRYLMAAGLSAFHYRRQQSVSILQHCFDALRSYKEKQKFKKLNNELTLDIIPTIEGLNQEIGDKVVENSFKNKTKACRAVSKMLGKQVYTYFEKWKQSNAEFKIKMQSQVKDRIIKLYLNTLRRGFTQWHSNADQIKNNRQQIIVQALEEGHSSLTEELSSLQKDVQERSQQLDKSQNKKLHGCILAYRKRLKQLAVGRWKDNIVSHHVKEDGAELLHKKIRARLLRSAFDLYKAGSDYKKKLQIEEERCQYLRNTRSERLKRRVYHAWCLYKTNFVRSKGYWNRIYIKMDLVMKQRALTRWKESAQLASEQQLENSQQDVVDQIEVMNAELGQLHTVEQELQSQNQAKKAFMIKQGQRVLGNAFVKYYYVGHSRGFEKWKEYVQLQKKREMLIKKMISHWKMYQFQNVKARFQRWMAGQDYEVNMQKLKREELGLSDLQFQYESQSKANRGTNQQLDKEQNRLQFEQRVYNQRLQKSVQLIVNKVDGNYYMSQKRYILQQWRDYVKREKHFIACIQNVIEKSIWQRGFSEIRGAARQKIRNDQLEIVLGKFRLKFWKRTCSSAFSQWKTGIYSSVIQNIEEIVDETEGLLQEHEARVVVRKQENTVKSAKLVKQSVQKNCFINWKYTTKQLKLFRLKTNNCHHNFELMNIRYAVMKWNARTRATKHRKTKVTRLISRLNRLKMKNAFEGMKNIFFAAKDFMSRMSNLANIHDQQALKIGYNSICSFVKAKNYVYKKKQEHAARDFNSILSNLMNRRMKSYIKDLKYKTSLQYKQSLHKVFTVMHKLNAKLRSYFQRWKQLNDHSKLAQDLNEEGPVRELWFDQKQLFDNCKRFMQSEGYNKGDIESALKQGSEYQKTLLLKSVRRMQHYNEDLNTKPKLFDRWKRYVHERKLFKYWLQYVDRRSTHVKSDLARYFDKWKQFDRSQKNALYRISKRGLDSKLIQNCNQLEDLADEIGFKENRIQHLDAQRAALIENYVKGQKLALGMLNNNIKRSMHKAFLKWSKGADLRKSTILEQALKKQIENITALKERLRSLEVDNESLANENEELRQFSLDGYEIAKNVQVLTVEREKLSVDLADKSQIIRRLLDENEDLTRCLRQAQSEAQQLIKEANGRFRKQS